MSPALQSDSLPSEPPGKQDCPSNDSRDLELLKLLSLYTSSSVLHWNRGYKCGCHSGNLPAPGTGSASEPSENLGGHPQLPS